MSSLVITLLLLCTRLSPVRVCVFPYRTEGESKGGSDSTERSVLCWRGGWYKDSLFCPWRRVTFASGLICILVHCAGMLLLLLVGLYSPDKTQPIKGFWASAVLPLPFAPCLYSAPFFLILGFFIPCPPFFSFWTRSLCSLSLFFCLFCKLWLCLSLRCLSDFIYRRMENLVAVSKIICCQRS